MLRTAYAQNGKSSTVTTGSNGKKNAPGTFGTSTSQAKKVTKAPQATKVQTKKKNAPGTF